MALLRPVVVRIDLRPELDLLDDRLRLVLARFPGLERGLVLELAVVHELGDRRPGGGCHLDQVEVGLLGQPERIVDAYDPHLLAGRADQPDLGDPDALVNAWFDADVTSLASPVSRSCTDRDGRPAGCALTLACRHTPKGPACRARRATIPRIRDRPRRAVTHTDPQRHGRPRAVARHRQRRVRPARRLRRQAYPPASGRPGGRWSSAYAPARCYPAGRQARLTAIWRAQVFRSRQALLPPALRCRATGACTISPPAPACTFHVGRHRPPHESCPRHSGAVGTSTTTPR